MAPSALTVRPAIWEKAGLAWLKEQLDHPGRALAPTDLVGMPPSSHSFPREPLWLPGPSRLILVAP